MKYGWLRCRGNLLAGLALAAATLAVSGAEGQAKKQVKKKRGQPIQQKMGERDSLTLDPALKKTESLKEEVEDTGPSLAGPSLRDSYEGLLDDRLLEEVRLAEELLQLETSCATNAPIQFRLADLYWEQSKRAFFKSEDFKSPVANRRKAKARMEALQRRAINTYRSLIRKCNGYRDDPEVEYPKMLYMLGSTLIEMQNGEEAARLFSRLIQEFPESEWTPRSWFMVGEYYYKEKQNTKKAYRAYENAASYEGSAIVPYAVFMQGWCHINDGVYERARRSFRRVLEMSNQYSDSLGATARRALQKGALKDYVQAYSYVGEPNDAYADFATLGGPKRVVDMMEWLGGWYGRSDAYNGMTTIYNSLLARHESHERAVVWRGRLLDAYANRQNIPKVLDEAAKLASMFEGIRERFNAGKFGPGEEAKLRKATLEAERIAENTLRRWGTRFHEQGMKLPEGGKPWARAYATAEKLYEQYLRIFPDPDPKAPVNYVFFVQYFMGDVYYQRERFADAGAAFDRVAGLGKHAKHQREKKFVARALEDAVRAYVELIEDLDRENPPEFDDDKVHPIPEIKQRLLAACDRYEAQAGAKGKYMVNVRYTKARIFFQYQHYDKAAPAFNNIVMNHPEDEVACDAANLALDIYVERDDFRNLRDKAKAYRTNPKLQCSSSDKKRFTDIERAGEFNVIRTEFETKGYFVKACNAYKRYFDTYGPSDANAVKALNNASVMCEKGNKIERAAELRELLIDRFAARATGGDQKIVKALLLQTSKLYETLANFPRAASYYERYAALFPKDPSAKDALYNAAYYRTMLDDIDGARQAQQLYLKNYPQSEDAGLLKKSQCAGLERKARDAMKRRLRSGYELLDRADGCYLEWLKRYGRVPNELCEAQGARRELMVMAGNKRGAEKQAGYLVQQWPRWQKAAATVKLDGCKKYVAKARLERLGPIFDDFRNMKIAPLNPQKKKAFDKSMAALAKKQDLLLNEYLEVLKIGDPDTAMHACHQRGEVLFHRVQAIEGAPVPDRIPGYKLSAEDKSQLRNRLLGLAAPIREQAVAAYRVCIETSAQQHVYTDAMVRSRGRMRELMPTAFLHGPETTAPINVTPPPLLPTNRFVVKQGDGYRNMPEKPQ